MSLSDNSKQNNGNGNLDLFKYLNDITEPIIQSINSPMIYLSLTLKKEKGMYPNWTMLLNSL